MQETPAEPIVVEDDKSMVLYCDGSARPNPGNIGFGIHGYLYDISPPKKGTGLSTHILSSYGYVPKEESTGVAEVTPLMYFDGYGCTDMITSNNVAELLGAAHSAKIAQQYPVKSLTIKTDSKYVLQGFTEWSPHWVRNRWIRRDGTPVPNQDIWKDFLRDINILTARGTTVDILKVKGHSDVLGNEKADRLAAVGSSNSIMGNSKVDIIKRVPEKYWNPESNRHAMLCQRRQYFNTLRYSHVPGEYFLGDHGKDDELLGVRDVDGVLSVVQLKQPEMAMELIREYQTKLSGDFDAVIIVNLDTLFTRGRNLDLQNYGIGALIKSDAQSNSLKTLDKEPLTHECKPVKIAQRVLDNISILKNALNNFRSGNLKGYFITDITDTIYDRTEKTVKKEQVIENKLKDQFIVGHKAHKVTVNVPGDDTTEITLTLGQDLPDRNALKRLEDPNISVKVLVWQEAPNAIRFVTVLNNGNDYGIWAGFYSNLVFLPGKT